MATRSKPKRKVRRRRVDKNGQMLMQYPLGWGGKRPGSGRKPKGGRAGTPHRARPSDKLLKRWPVHVVMRVVEELPSLRSRRCMGAIRRAFYGGRERFGFRLVHFSVQGNHMHLMVEADDRKALLKGMQGLSVRLARQLNRALGRKGKVFADRYHAEVLDSLARIRHALAYVLNNERRHSYRSGWIKLEGYIDPCSSGLFFDGWREQVHCPKGVDPPVVVARRYPLQKGWRRHGRISVSEIPGA